MKNKTGEV